MGVSPWTKVHVRLPMALPAADGVFLVADHLSSILHRSLLTARRQMQRNNAAPLF